MTVSRTFADCYNRIADELGGRTDLLSNSANMSTPPIQLAIQDAIREWERQRFYFNEIRTASAFSTVLNQEFYTSADAAFIATAATIDKMSILIGGNRLRLEPRTADYMEDISMNPTNTGQPVEYAYYGEKIRFYPIPNGVYPVNALYTQRLAELTAAGDTNVWVNDAEELIRLTAKEKLYAHTLMDDVSAERMRKAIGRPPYTGGALAALRGETARRVATRRVTPTYF